MTGYDGLDSPKLGSSPKYSEETVTCDSDGKPGHEPDYIKGELRESFSCQLLLFGIKHIIRCCLTLGRSVGVYHSTE